MATDRRTRLNALETNSSGDAEITCSCLNQDFHFGPGTVKVYTRAAPNTTSFRAEPCT